MRTNANHHDNHLDAGIPFRGWHRAAPLAVLIVGIVGALPAHGAEKLKYNRDIRPILAENCFACHGPDSASRKANLRLDRREVAIETKAIAPGDAKNSGVIERIFSDDPEVIMPPPVTHKKLSAAQRETLKQWIAQGAEYQPHWSFMAPARPQPPKVKNTAWVRNPIDAFVLARIESEGLQLAPEADRRTLARRLSLDLTGLPPAPADVEAFVNDTSSDAYAKYIDRLLDSKHWGEHRARYWLDVARYADSHGIHFDNYREIWSYRDWVIAAFNRNQRFDQFTTEQLAGDLLANRTLDQVVASGFNRCNITTNEGGAISEEYSVLYTRDRTETLGQVWLGMTAGCTVCHDHKFDPMTQREFYKLAAFFNNTTQQAMDGNIKDTPPTVFVPMPDDRQRWESLVGQIAAARQAVNARRQAARADFDKWLTGATSQIIAAGIPSTDLKFHAPLAEGTGNAVTLSVAAKSRAQVLPKGIGWDVGQIAAKAFRTEPGGTIELADVGDFDKNQAFSCGAWVKFTSDNPTGAIVGRMDENDNFRGWDLWIENGRVGSHIIHKWQDDALKAVANNPLPKGQWSHVLVTYDGSANVAGLKVYVNGAAQPTSVQANALKNTTRTKVPLKIGQRNNSARLDGMHLQDVRIYGRALAALEAEQLAKGTRAAWLAAKPAKDRTDAEKNELFDWWLPGQDALYQAAVSKTRGLEQEDAAIRSRGTIAYVMQERMEKPEAYILFRGEYDKRRDKVEPDTPALLPPFAKDTPRNRLGLAQWLLRPDHPLTARVTVNRFWQELFGTGIVRTAGDFGAAGELPSHQELLDWLAVEFRESGWDVKQLFRLLVSSAAYRQSAVLTKDKLEKDPQNRLLSRGPRFRMDGEMIRDYALAASGLLVPKLGGPSVRPYMPEGVWEAVAMIGSNTRDYVPDKGDGLYRRSMYTFWKRAAPPASMDIFNAPSREVCTVRRERTNTPLQALVTLNDVQFVEAARHLAQKTIKEGGAAAESRLNYVSMRLLARPLQTEELSVVQATLKDLLAFYQTHAKEAKELIAVGDSKADPTLDPAQLAAWTMLANQMMNLDEVLNK